MKQREARLKNELRTGIGSIPAKIEGPFSLSSSEASELFPARIKYKQATAAVRLGSGKKNIYLFTMTNGEQYIAIGGSKDDPDYIFPAKAVNKNRLSDIAKKLDESAKRYLEGLGIGSDNLFFHYSIDPERITSRYNMSCLPVSKQSENICVMKQNGQGYKKGCNISDSCDFESTMRLAISKTLVDELRDIRVMRFRQWYETEFEKLPFYDRCVLFALQNPTTRFSVSSMSVSQVKDVLKLRVGIETAHVPDVLERMTKTNILKDFLYSYVTSRQKKGSYGWFNVYQLSDVFREAKITIKKPKPSTPADAFEYKENAARLIHLRELSKEIRTSEEVIEIVSFFIEKKASTALKEYIATPEGIRIFSLLSEKDRILVKYMLGNANGFKILSKAPILKSGI